MKLQEIRELILSEDIHKRESGEFPRKFGKVYLADDELLEIVGKGDVQIRTLNGSISRLHNVRYIPRLKRNLISIGQLDNNWYKIIFGNSSLRIVNGAIVVARGIKKVILYMTDENRDTIDIACTKEKLKLWHCRLGHMSDFLKEIDKEQNNSVLFSDS
ncbi:Retrovirus-related Pol polyprotein from transposon TNT 1-94 [Apostasia shenzhenica]|uniref:Retrovirus-related Pol polyprotein from transposon TNT 1-94 n=1 Tax=Apostasia shenzhenica TaxID=1088818 RepID=A0A2I0B3X8_9ASPA|nr:Retrovirus-related Pol polyprotein from transposon TNT 1-94 [Apostasia shenzhenica]